MGVGEGGREKGRNGGMRDEGWKEKKNGIQRIETSLSALKEENSYLTQVEIDKMSCFVCHIATKITSYNAMPSWVVLLVELFLDECCDILKNQYQCKLIVVKNSEIDSDIDLTTLLYLTISTTNINS